MNIKPQEQNSAIEECMRALKSCPHNHGTVRVMCRVCLDQGETFGYDMDQAKYVVIDCPRCTSESEFKGAELCQCMEEFHPETIAAAIRRQRSGRVDRREGNEGKEWLQDRGAQEPKDEFGPLSEALKWVQERDQPGVPLDGQSAAEEMTRLRAWAKGHQEIVIPHPKATLILHLLDHDMIEFATLPETGKLVFRAKGAKEEFSRFIAELNRNYVHDERTVRLLLRFAYSINHWKFDPAELQEYPRGLEIPEIHSGGYDVQAPCGILRGDPQEIEGVVRTSYGCFGVKTRSTWPPRKDTFRIRRNGRCTWGPSDAE
jgi:hypothetical protein